MWKQRYSFIVALLFIGNYYFMFSLLTIKKYSPIPRPKLLVLVPYVSRDIPILTDKLKTWELPDYISIIFLRDNLKTKTVDISILLKKGISAKHEFANTTLPYPWGPSDMFYQAFDKYFGEYDCMFWMEHDVKILSKFWATTLVEQCDNSFWVKGSLNHLEDYKNIGEGTAVGHINGNALYNLKDAYFKDFVEIVQGYENPNRGGLPFDVALWTVFHNFPYSWNYYQRFPDKFRHNNFIMNFNQIYHYNLRTHKQAETVLLHASKTLTDVKSYFWQNVTFIFDCNYPTLCLSIRKSVQTFHPESKVIQASDSRESLDRPFKMDSGIIIDLQSDDNILTRRLTTYDIFWKDGCLQINKDSKILGAKVYDASGRMPVYHFNTKDFNSADTFTPIIPPYTCNGIQQLSRQLSDESIKAFHLELKQAIGRPRMCYEILKKYEQMLI